MKFLRSDFSRWLRVPMVKARSRPRSNETFESELRVRPKNGFMTIVQMPHCDPVDFNLQASVEA